MRIGIDFDNTIVSYDDLFHQIALEKQSIPPNLPKNKLAVRDHLRAVGKEDLWTLIQGEVYGSRISEAIAYPGFANFAKKATAFGHQIFIISHRTKHPFAGPKYDLHSTAREWIKKFMAGNKIPINQNTNIFFETSKEDKILQIHLKKCDIFIDDLPEILAMPGFPKKTKKILFDIDRRHLNMKAECLILPSWIDIENHLLK